MNYEEGKSGALKRTKVRIRPAHFSECMICGKPLVYSGTETMRKCAVCGREYSAGAACRDGHYVCDNCHSAAAAKDFGEYLLKSRERDAIKLFEGVMALPGVHMHGPEHHAIVPCVLLTAYRNNGGKIDYIRAAAEIKKRAEKVPGGACGYWGVCGAAAGAGIYTSAVLGSNPLNKDVWNIPIKLVSRCLARIAGTGGPRCCKRTSRIAIEEAAQFTEEILNIHIPAKRAVCRYAAKNRECIGDKCPYFGKDKDNGF